MLNVIDKIRIKLLKHKFEKRYVNFNKYTKKAFKVKEDSEFKNLCIECFNDVAKQNRKDIKSVSLEDIYRVLHKIRRKTPKLLRKITLYQIINSKNIISSTGDVFNIIYFISNLTPIPLMYVGLKKIFGKRIEYVVKIYVVWVIAKEIYEDDKNI